MSSTNQQYKKGKPKKIKLCDRFKKLLPEIYKKIIHDGWTHYAVSEWLKEEHDLDFFRTDSKGNIHCNQFTTYLFKYGDMDTARKTYEECYLHGSSNVAESWLDLVNLDSDATDNEEDVQNKPTPPNNNTIESKVSDELDELDLQKSSGANIEPKPKPTSVRQADRFADMIGGGSKKGVTGANPSSGHSLLEDRDISPESALKLKKK